MDNLLFYSTNTYIANNIASQFYSGMHYVWCSPVFDPKSLDAMNVWKNIPPSSSPYNIYWQLKQDVESKDMHSPKIEANKVGLKRGALEALKNKMIDDVEYSEIIYMIDTVDIDSFRPLLYLIPKSLVFSKIEEVPIEKRANPLGIEYRIKNLQNTEFEIIHQL
ncbi:hypothetical protein EZS27_006320 [termite gut metagenome]|uniref:Uncharacterized protein n=1 Tax=termite gut metagenome TaxID=433724 RepID=A0A5J4SLM3_9ZZZZ